MKRSIVPALLFATAAMVAMPTLIDAAPLLIVRADGTGDYTSLSGATSNIDDGGVIQVTEAGTYAFISTFPGGKSYTIEATVPEVVAEGTGNFAWDMESGPVNATLRGFEIRRPTGTGQAMTIDQHPTHSVKVVMEDMRVRHVLDASGGEALKFNIGVAGGAPVSLTATNTQFEALTQSGSGKSAIRVQSTNAPVENLTVTLTNCDLSSFNEAVVRSDAGANQHWTLTGCTLTNPFSRGFRVDQNQHNDSSFTFVDTTITVGLESLRSAAPNSENVIWSIDRCTLDSSAAFAAARTVYLDYDNTNGVEAGTGGNELTIFNSLIISQEGGDASNIRAVDIDNFAVATFHHNTVAASGSGGARAFASARTIPFDFSNNVLIGYLDPVSGSTGTKTGNAIAGPSEDTSAGADVLYTADVTTFELDENYVPADTSPLVGHGDPAIALVVGNVDRNGNPRQNPPTSGAFEVEGGVVVPTVGSWIFVD